MSRPAPITLDDCEALFYLPVARAAAVLGVSRPTISKVLRAHGIKRWPYRRLRAEGKLESLRMRREHLLPPLHPPSPPPLPPHFALPRLLTSAHAPLSTSAPLVSSPRSLPSHPALPSRATEHAHLPYDMQWHTHAERDEEPPHVDLLPRIDDNSDAQEMFTPTQATVDDDETYILKLLDDVGKVCARNEDDDMCVPALSTPPAAWNCEEDIDADCHGSPMHVKLPRLDLGPDLGSTSYAARPSSASSSGHRSRSHTTCTVRHAARAVVGAGDWSHGWFEQHGDRSSFSFLPCLRLGSSLSENDPAYANIAHNV